MYSSQKGQDTKIRKTDKKTQQNMGMTLALFMNRHEITSIKWKTEGVFFFVGDKRNEIYTKKDERLN